MLELFCGIIALAIAAIVIALAIDLPVIVAQIAQFAV